MIIAVTGHRPVKVGGYILPNPTYIKICKEFDRLLRELKPEKCISGMALGVDQYFANVAIKLNIPLIAAIPFLGQENAWPKSSQDIYKRLLKKASEIKIISAGDYSPYLLQKRNEWMVDSCDLLLSCHDGSPGGTFNCINYAKLKNKKIININPNSPSPIADDRVLT